VVFASDQLETPAPYYHAGHGDWLKDSFVLIVRGDDSSLRCDCSCKASLTRSARFFKALH